MSDASIRALKPRADTFSVTDEKGLSLLVKPTGSKLWRFRYQFQGKPRVMALGSYPEVPLSEARRKRDTARTDVQAGVDPGAEKKKAKLLSVLATANTFSAIAEEYIVTKLIGENRAAITVDKARWLLSHLSPVASLPVAEIKPQELYAALKRLEGSGKHETARRCRSFSSRVFRYAVVTGRAETDPAAMLSGALITPKVKHHAAPIDPAKVGDVLRAIDAYSTGAPITRLALQIAPHVMTRPGELRQALWEEFDLDAAIWRIPAGRMKARRSHAIPLSRQVVDYLREVREFSGPTGYVFPAFHTSRKPMSENTMNQAFRRMGFTGDEVTSHGLRTTASTLLNESGKWHPDAIERSLAHGDSDAVRGIYNRGHYWQERVEMMQWWSDYLDQLRAGGEIVRWRAANDRHLAN
nr:integrase arm-type DNA-binding domain-containing protein [Sphingobium nicotianae]